MLFWGKWLCFNRARPNSALFTRVNAEKHRSDPWRFTSVFLRIWVLAFHVCFFVYENTVKSNFENHNAVAILVANLLIFKILLHSLSLNTVFIWNILSLQFEYKMLLLFCLIWHEQNLKSKHKAWYWSIYKHFQIVLQFLDNLL